ncbi:Rho-type gtpase-activating protein [Coniosporium apollinis]|uniref:Rho-type gtpase-activating protein n=1 Tax=Coniosporium apollinis TaxID=61459 RepID=A0ABQ9NWR1_9PEZI|nr:Rho-type gtpase-activating protein [Coniosporium apollinis]
MARRRKKSKANRQQAPTPGSTAPIVLDKSLPALPPNAIPQSAFTPDMETPPEDVYMETPMEASPQQDQSRSRRDGARKIRREASPAALEDGHNLTLPASTYKANRRSGMFQPADQSLGGDDGFFVPLALDPNPAPGLSPHADSRKYQDETPKREGGRDQENKQPAMDYFGNARNAPPASHREVLKENRSGSSRSNSTERERQPKVSSSPHIAYQEKGRQPSVDLMETIRKRKESGPSTSTGTSPVTSMDRQRVQHASSPSTTTSKESDTFKLQEAPRPKKSGSRKSSRTEDRPPIQTSASADMLDRMKTLSIESGIVTSPTSPEPSRVSAQEFPRHVESPVTSQESASSHGSAQVVERPARGDSLAAQAHRQALSRREVGARSSPSTPTAPIHKRQASTSSTKANREDQLAQLNGGYTASKLQEAPSLPSRSSGRPPPPGAAASTDSFTAPRAPPPLPPPPVERHRANESTSTIRSDGSRPSDHHMSPALLRYSAGGEFSMEEDMARILRGDEGPSHDSSVLRRVSNAVKHGRSFSDKGSLRHSAQKWRSPHNGAIDISSPTIASPDSKEEVIQLRNELRRAQQRITELETEKNGLEEKVNGSVVIKQMNTELREKRSTVAFLDTQREIVVRELETMTDHLKKAKDTNQQFAMQTFQADVLKDFGIKMQKLKDTMSSTIEDLVHKRNELTDEISNLIQMKDKGFQEYESLSTQNMRLQEMNNRLLQNIQELYKQNRQPQGNSFDGGRPPANGLGIYTHHQKDRSDTAMDLRNIMAQDGSMLNLLQDADADHTVLPAPQVVNIRKGKPSKFSWKKGQQAVSKKLRGINDALGGNQEHMRDGQYSIEGTPYGAMPSGPEISAPTPAPGGLKPSMDPKHGAGFGFFGAQKGGSLKASQFKHLQADGSNTNVSGESSSVLFGSDLSARCDFEKRQIPAIVSQCIQEVESRGMDVEGIYRKSGGSGQVNNIRQGFEKHDQFDISDPDLDIHAVTSALKQYFRKLPNPLITFDVYDHLLEAGQIEDKEKKALAMRLAIRELPQSHQDCLEFLIFHLARVMAHDKENLMTPLNLSVVFAPTIMRPLSIEREMNDMQAQRIAVQALLENNKIIFAES